jgi:hypothetical protein
LLSTFEVWHETEHLQAEKIGSAPSKTLYSRCLAAFSGQLTGMIKALVGASVPTFSALPCI